MFQKLFSHCFVQDTECMRVVGDTLDDLLFQLFKKLLKAKKLSATRGAMREVVGAHLILTNPRARFSSAEKRAVLFSCLAETLWYLTGSGNLSFIEYHIPNYRKYLEIPKDATSTPGAYGPRMFAPTLETSQVERVIQQLRGRDSTRKAVIQVYSNLDALSHDPPCTCTLQFFIRDSKVELITFMRSNDAYMGLPHDIFAFTWIQELVASSLGREVGPYQHMVGSLHIYDTSIVSVHEYLNEGWQPKTAMPKMPHGNPWPSINWLLKAEGQIRSEPNTKIQIKDVAPYWQDIARLLRVQELLKLKNKREIVSEKNNMSSDVYNNFIRSKSVKIDNNKDDQVTSDLFQGQ
jgi:thymidylate synthase